MRGTQGGARKSTALSCENEIERAITRETCTIVERSSTENASSDRGIKLGGRGLDAGASSWNGTRLNEEALSSTLTYFQAPKFCISTPKCFSSFADSSSQGQDEDKDAKSGRFTSLLNPSIGNEDID